MILVALEGIEGSGKTSVTEALEQAEVPDLTLCCTGELRSPIGPLLRNRLPQLSPLERVHWFAADRASTLEQVRTSIDIEQPTVVVWDRYLDSARAYRSAEVELGVAPLEILELVERVNQAFPAPDRVLFLDTDPSVARARLARVDREPDTRMLGALRYYRDRARQESDVFRTIDGGLPLDEVVASVVEQLGRDYGRSDRTT